MQDVEVPGNAATARDAKGKLHLSERTSTAPSNADIVGNRTGARTGGRAAGGAFYVDVSQATWLISDSLANKQLDGPTTAGPAILGGSNAILPTFALCNVHGNETPAVLCQRTETTPTSTSERDPSCTAIFWGSPLTWNVRRAGPGLLRSSR